MALTFDTYFTGVNMIQMERGITKTSTYSLLAALEYFRVQVNEVASQAPDIDVRCSVLDRRETDTAIQEDAGFGNLYNIYSDAYVTKYGLPDWWDIALPVKDVKNIEGKITDKMIEDGVANDSNLEEKVLSLGLDFGGSSTMNKVVVDTTDIALRITLVDVEVGDSVKVSFKRDSDGVEVFTKETEYAEDGIVIQTVVPELIATADAGELVTVEIEAITGDTIKNINLGKALLTTWFDSYLNSFEVIKGTVTSGVIDYLELGNETKGYKVNVITNDGVEIPMSDGAITSGEVVTTSEAIPFDVATYDATPVGDTINLCTVECVDTLGRVVGSREIEYPKKEELVGMTTVNDASFLTSKDSDTPLQVTFGTLNSDSSKQILIFNDIEVALATEDTLSVGDVITIKGIDVPIVEINSDNYEEVDSYYVRPTETTFTIGTDALQPAIPTETAPRLYGTSPAVTFTNNEVFTIVQKDADGVEYSSNEYVYLSGSESSNIILPKYKYDTFTSYGLFKDMDAFLVIDTFSGLGAKGSIMRFVASEADAEHSITVSDAYSEEMDELVGPFEWSPIAVHDSLAPLAYCGDTYTVGDMKIVKDGTEAVFLRSRFNYSGDDFITTTASYVTIRCVDDVNFTFLRSDISVPYSTDSLSVLVDDRGQGRNFVLTNVEDNAVYTINSDGTAVVIPNGEYTFIVEDTVDGTVIYDSVAKNTVIEAHSLKGGVHLIEDLDRIMVDFRGYILTSNERQNTMTLTKKDGTPMASTLSMVIAMKPYTTSVYDNVTFSGDDVNSSVTVALDEKYRIGVNNDFHAFYEFSRYQMAISITEFSDGGASLMNSPIILQINPQTYYHLGYAVDGLDTEEYLKPRFVEYNEAYLSEFGGLPNHPAEASSNPFNCATASGVDNASYGVAMFRNYDGGDNSFKFVVGGLIEDVYSVVEILNAEDDSPIAVSTDMKKHYRMLGTWTTYSYTDGLIFDLPITTTNFNVKVRLTRASDGTVETATTVINVGYGLKNVYPNLYYSETPA